MPFQPIDLGFPSHCPEGGPAAVHMSLVGPGGSLLLWKSIILELVALCQAGSGQIT